MTLHEYSKSQGYPDFWLAGFLSLVGCNRVNHLVETDEATKERLDKYVQTLIDRCETKEERRKARTKISRAKQKYRMSQ